MRRANFQADCEPAAGGNAVSLPKRAETVCLAEELRRRADFFFSKNRRGQYICPVCGNGSGRSQTGLSVSSAQGKTVYSCFGACQTRGRDVIGFMALARGLEHRSFTQQVHLLAAECGLLNSGSSAQQQVPPACSQSGDLNFHMSGTDAPRHMPAPGAAQETPDFSSFYACCQQRLGQCDYFTARGLSLRLQKRFGLGFDPGWVSPAALRRGFNPPPSPRAIIPLSKTAYVARDVRPSAALSPGELRYVKMKEGHPAGLFNAEALNAECGFTFVLEGELDALSLEECGFPGLGLGSVANLERFCQLLAARRPANVLLIALDNDEPGWNAARRLLEHCRNLGLQARLCISELCLDFKDPNEHLMRDRQSLCTACVRILEACGCGTPREHALLSDDPAAGEDGTVNAAALALDIFDRRAALLHRKKPIPTGWTVLDEALGYGLHPGLYVLGAGTGAGKTTLALQMACAQSAAGHDVLFFSLEMSTEELTARILARFMAELAVSQGSPQLACTPREILMGYADCGEATRQLYEQARQRMLQQAGRLFLNEGGRGFSGAELKGAVEKHINLYRRRPVVYLDYLQILRHDDSFGTDKQHMDRILMDLKSLSRDYGLSLIIISSFNRDAYRDNARYGTWPNEQAIPQSRQTEKTPRLNRACSYAPAPGRCPDEAAFKESGAIEYTADVLLGLQLKGQGSFGFDRSAALQADPRALELFVIKNRHGPSGQRINLYCYPVCALFALQHIPELEDLSSEPRLQQALSAAAAVNEIPLV